jgi:flavorubredoxin
MIKTGKANNPLPREVGPGVFWLGECYEIPFDGGAVHANNSAFLVAGEEHTAIVETGIPWDTPVILKQIAGLIEKRGYPDVRYVFPTHSEQAHSGGLGRILERYPRATAHGDVSDLHMVFPEFVERMHFVDPGDRFDLGGTEIVVVEAVFRDLVTTRWFFDTARRALFTGDGIAYAHYHSDRACGMCVEEAAAVDMPGQMNFFGISAFHWTKFVDIEPYADRLEDLVLRELDAAYILPTHGLPVNDPVSTMPRIREGLFEMSRTAPATGAAVDNRHG